MLVPILLTARELYVNLPEAETGFTFLLSRNRTFGAPPFEGPVLSDGVPEATASDGVCDSEIDRPKSWSTSISSEPPVGVPVAGVRSGGTESLPRTVILAIGG